jgi:hypothetical protein
MCLNIHASSMNGPKHWSQCSKSICVIHHNYRLRPKSTCDITAQSNGCPHGYDKQNDRSIPLMFFRKSTKNCKTQADFSFLKIYSRLSVSCGNSLLTTSTTIVRFLPFRKTAAWMERLKHMRQCICFQCSSRIQIIEDWDVVIILMCFYYTRCFRH